MNVVIFPTSRPRWCRLGTVHRRAQRTTHRSPGRPLRQAAMLPPTQTSLQPVRVVGGWSNAQVSPNRKKALCCSLCCIFVLQFRCRSDVAQCHLTQSCVTLTPAAASAATDAAAATSLSSSATEEGTCILAKGENLPLLDTVVCQLDSLPA